MFRQNNDNDNTATTKRVTEQRTEYRTDNANVAPSSGRAYVVDRNDRNYDNNNRSSSYNYNNRSAGYNNNNRGDYDDNDNRGGWWEGVKENVRDWWHGDENDRDYDNSGRDYNSGRGYHTGQRNYDRDYDRTSYNRNTIGGGYGYNSGDRFNVTARRVDYDTPSSSNYRYGGSYGGSYGGPSRNYGGDYDRSYGQGRSYTQNTSSNYDRSYGGGFGGYGPSSYGGGYGGPSYGNRSVAVYGGAGSNDYDRLYGNNNTRQVQSRSRYNNTNNDMSDLFGDLSLLSDRHETTPNIIEEGGQRMMQWSFDVQGFNLDDIQISDSGSNKIEITGKHEDIGAHHRHAKQFTRIVTLPQNTTAKDVKSRINGRGLLTVTVPYSGKSLNDYNTRELTVGTGGSSSAQRSSGQHSSSSQYGSSSNNNQQHGTTGAATTTTTSTSKQQYQSTSNA